MERKKERSALRYCIVLQNYVSYFFLSGSLLQSEMFEEVSDFCFEEIQNILASNFESCTENLFLDEDISDKLFEKNKFMYFFNSFLVF